MLIEPGAIQTRFRANALAAFHRFIDPAQSRHRDAYLATIKRLAREDEIHLSLPAESVLTVTRKALERRRPRPRYRVTRSAMLLAAIKRWLPDRWMDGLIQRLGA